QIEYFFTFDSTNGAMDDFSLFERAEIKSFNIHKELPLYLEEHNLKWLATLLSGCAIENMSLIFDKSTLKNLHLIPPFLASVHCRSVEFVLEKSREYNMVEAF
ncbi:hypothetical protein PFISCL1PPCAC_21653, partial [Pristionchus fissidentatus]